MPTGLWLLFMFVNGPCNQEAVLPYNYAKGNKKKIRKNI